MRLPRAHRTTVRCITARTPRLATHIDELPVAYLAFPGKQHGFRQADTIRRVLDAELYFYSRVFRFEPADPLEPMPIDNLTP